MPAPRLARGPLPLDNLSPHLKNAKSTTMVDLAIAFAKVGSPGEDPFDLEGDLLDGQFRIEKCVGEGELSVVYRGLHEAMDAPVAIKCLDLPDTLDPKLVEPIAESFRESARVHYRLGQGHLHIARPLAFGTTIAPRTGQPIPYLIREWLDGRSLAADFAERAAKKARPRTAAQAFELFDSAADAIAYAHAEGVCHHSLSPSNLFVAKLGRREVLKVLDFGTARALTDPSRAGLRLSSSHLAPEQIDRRIGEPSAATDVFVLALVLFEAVTGRPYFEPGVHPSEMLRLAESREPLRRRGASGAVPRELESVLTRALAPKPRDRHANVRVFWDDVKRAVQRPLFAMPPKTQPVQPQEAPAPQRPPPPVVVAARPSPSSCTAEVAPPVAVSVLDEADLEADHEHDTVPAPPGFEAEALAPPDPMLASVTTAVRVPTRAALRAQWDRLYAKTREWSPPAAARIGVLSAVGLVALALAITSVARSEPNVLAATTDLHAARVAQSEPAVLVHDTRPRVPKPSGFDRSATRARLAETADALESCTKIGSPRGPGSIRIIIHPNGTIMRLQIGPPYAGTSTGDCISRRFVSTRLPAFAGPPQALNYIFNTIPFERP
jgi:eukaryotic-like serine/threonine-protein kinase